MKCVEKMQKGRPHKASWRRKNTSVGFLLFGCPKWAWRVKRKRCVVGMRLWEKVSVVKGGRCRKGYRRIK
jgi:hypothetical protein